MKKVFSSVILAVAAAMIFVGCSKDEVSTKIPEINLIGNWKAPYDVSRGAIQGLGGKNLIIYPDHTAVFESLKFNYWKFEGNELTFTNYTEAEHGVDHVLDVLHYTIAIYSDTVMALVGTYTHTVGDSVYLTADMSGTYEKKVILPPVPQP